MIIRCSYDTYSSLLLVSGYVWNTRSTGKSQRLYVASGVIYLKNWSERSLPNTGLMAHFTKKITSYGSLSMRKKGDGDCP